MKYYIIQEQQKLIIMKVKDEQMNEFEKDYVGKILVEKQPSIQDVLVKFGELSQQGSIQLEEGTANYKQSQEIKHENDKLKRTSKHQHKL